MCARAGVDEWLKAPETETYDLGTIICLTFAIIEPR